MKKVVYLISFSILALGACKKKYCWECTTVQSGGATGSSNTTVCDQTEEEIKSRIGSTTSVDSSGTKPIQIVSTTTCTKQN
jgi:hypothetical protein